MSQDRSNAELPDPPSGPDGSGFPRWLKFGLLGALAVLILGYGAIFLYANVIKDNPDALDTGDRDAALAGAGDDDSAADTTPAESTEAPPAESTEAPAAESTEAPPTESTEAPAAESTEPAAAATTEPAAAATTEAPTAATTEPPAAEAGAWRITSPSELGYRVKEVLFGVDTEAVGRTDQVEGSLVIEGTTLTSAEFVVDVASIASDDSRRDGQFRGRIMSTDEFPEAAFVLTAPIELGTEPADGAAVITDATGELTLRGVTNQVTFEVDAAVDNGRIGVLGSIPVVFEEYGIDNPSFGGVTTEDEGLLEFVLVFEQG